MADLTYLSLGGGVQSTALLLMAHAGELEGLDAAIFADTQWEPASVYENIEWLKAEVDIPIHVVSVSDLAQDTAHGVTSNQRNKFTTIPAFTPGAGMGRRQCSPEYKIKPIVQHVRSMLGLKKGHSRRGNGWGS